MSWVHDKFDFVLCETTDTYHKYKLKNFTDNVFISSLSALLWLASTEIYDPLRRKLMATHENDTFKYLEMKPIKFGDNVDFEFVLLEDNTNQKINYPKYFNPSVFINFLLALHSESYYNTRYIGLFSSTNEKSEFECDFNTNYSYKYYQQYNTYVNDDPLLNVHFELIENTPTYHKYTLKNTDTNTIIKMNDGIKILARDCNRHIRKMLINVLKYDTFESYKLEFHPVKYNDTNINFEFVLIKTECVNGEDEDENKNVYNPTNNTTYKYDALFGYDSIVRKYIHTSVTVIGEDTGNNLPSDMGIYYSIYKFMRYESAVLTFTQMQQENNDTFTHLPQEKLLKIFTQMQQKNLKIDTFTQMQQENFIQTLFATLYAEMINNPIHLLWVTNSYLSPFTHGYLTFGIKSNFDGYTFEPYFVKFMPLI